MVDEYPSGTFRPSRQKFIYHHDFSCIPTLFCFTVFAWYTSHNIQAAGVPNTWLKKCSSNFSEQMHPVSSLSQVSIVHSWNRFEYWNRTL